MPAISTSETFTFEKPTTLKLYTLCLLQTLLLGYLLASNLTPRAGSIRHHLTTRFCSNFSNGTKLLCTVHEPLNATPHSVIEPYNRVLLNVHALQNQHPKFNNIPRRFVQIPSEMSFVKLPTACFLLSTSSILFPNLTKRQQLLPSIPMSTRYMFSLRVTQRHKMLDGIKPAYYRPCSQHNLT